MRRVGYEASTNSTRRCALSFPIPLAGCWMSRMEVDALFITTIVPVGWAGLDCVFM